LEVETSDFRVGEIYKVGNINRGIKCLKHLDEKEMFVSTNISKRVINIS